MKALIFSLRSLCPRRDGYGKSKRALGWLRTTWFPYADRLPVELRDVFLSEVVAAYIDAYPIDALGNTHVRMVRLEVEAYAL